jgi:hypothetical protein
MGQKNFQNIQNKRNPLRCHRISRVHMSLGPGIPAPLACTASLRASTSPSAGPPSASQSRAGWTAHEYWLEKVAGMQQGINAVRMY